MRVSINDHSSIVTEEEIRDVLPALRGQASELCYAWGLDRPVIGSHLTGANVVNIDIFDDSDMQGALGYHDMVDGRPMARVFAKTDLEYGLDWRVTLSHELLELLADASALAAIQIGQGAFTALEVCDAVQSDRHGEVRDGFTLSNWIYPSWFDWYGEAPFDKMGLLTEPMTLLPGGYIIFWTPENGWTNIHAQSTEDVSRSQMGIAHRSIIRTEADKYGPLPANPIRIQK